mgnify:FL=1
MKETIDDLKERIACAQVRVGIVALLCLTVIALVAMMRLADPENIVINVIVGIGCFSGGVAAERMAKSRTTDKGE